MATNFPASLDSLTNPAAGDSLSSPSHSAQHANVNDAVEALQAKVGVDGSAVTSSLDYKVANQGLTFIKSQTIGSGVSSVTVTGAFSSTFDNYHIVLSGISSTVDNYQYQFSLTGGANLWYYAGIYYAYTTATGGFLNGGSAQAFIPVGYTASYGANAASFDVYGPYATDRTRVCAPGGAGQDYFTLASGMHATAASFTSFTISLSAGTLTGGTIRVYGYNNG